MFLHQCDTVAFVPEVHLQKSATPWPQHWGLRLVRSEHSLSNLSAKTFGTSKRAFPGQGLSVWLIRQFSIFTGAVLGQTTSPNIFTIWNNICCSVSMSSSSKIIGSNLAIIVLELFSIHFNHQTSCLQLFVQRVESPHGGQKKKSIPKQIQHQNTKLHCRSRTLDWKFHWRLEHWNMKRMSAVDCVHPAQVAWLILLNSKLEGVYTWCVSGYLS